MPFLFLVEVNPLFSISCFCILFLSCIEIITFYHQWWLCQKIIALFNRSDETWSQHLHISQDSRHHFWENFLFPKSSVKILALLSCHVFSFMLSFDNLIWTYWSFHSCICICFFVLLSAHFLCHCLHVLILLSITCFTKNT